MFEVMIRQTIKLSQCNINLSNKEPKIKTARRMARAVGSSILTDCSEDSPSKAKAHHDG
jgi:hypothetical protein